MSQAAVLPLMVKQSHMTLALFISTYTFKILEISLSPLTIYTVPVFFLIPWSVHFRTNPFVIFVYVLFPCTLLSNYRKLHLSEHRWPITIVSVTVRLNMLNRHSI